MSPQHKVSSSQSTTKQAFSIGGIYHVTVRFSLEPDRHFLGALPDSGDFLKMVAKHEDKRLPPERIMG
jgi:hypothetical protein